ncbi:MAG TPA: MFS transporter [Burkholderiales bacterium]|nr:MFS transporter [Burkholderiales bacterium]
MPGFLPLGVVALTLAIAYGIWYAYSVILVALLAEFGWSRSTLAGAFSVFTLVHGGMNPVVGALCARFRPLRVMATGGVLMGISLFACSTISTPLELFLYFGIATAAAVCIGGWVPSLVFVQGNFPERLGLSIGIISSGVGVGMLLVVPLTQWLIEAFGWRAAFQALGLIAVAWIVPSSLWLRKFMLKKIQNQIRGRSPEKKNQATSGSVPRQELTLRQAMRTEPFWLFLAAFFFGNVCSQTMHVHQVAFLVDKGLAAMVAASVVGVVGLASIFAKTGGGWLADRMERELVYVGGITIMVTAAFALLFVGEKPTAWGAYGYAILLGVGYSATASLIPAMLSDRYSGRHFGSIVGVGLMGSAAGSALGPWLAGTLYDALGSYTVPLLVAAGCGVIAGWTGWRARSLRLRAAG